MLSVMRLPAAAGAQDIVAERASREGPGFKVGRLVLHPGLGLEGGWDSNVFLQDSNEESSFILRLQGYLDVATEGAERQAEGETNEAEPQKIEFRGGVGAMYYHYFLERVPDNVAADAHVDFSYNPSNVFPLVVRDVFPRYVRPFSEPNTTTGTTISYGRNRNAASLELVGRSKSGVLEGRVGYTNVLELFSASLYAYADNMTHLVPATFSWLFFPTSALVYTVEYAHQSYSNPADVAASPTSLSDSNRVSSMVGYNGAITERFSLTAMIGYAAGFYQNGQAFDDVIARVDFRWMPRRTVGLTTGYDRLIRPSYIGNYTTVDRLRADARFTIIGALDLGVKAWLSFDNSGLALRPDGTTLLGNQPTRKDIRFLAALYGEYRFKPWLGLFGEVGYLADFTDFQYVGTAALVDPVARYKKFQAWLGLRVFY